ncbi:MAG TPA: sodium:proton antiporter [Pirellulales bacterium]
MNHEHAEPAAPSADYSKLIGVLGAVLIAYVVALFLGYPQAATRAIISTDHSAAHDEAPGDHSASPGAAHSERKLDPPALPWVAPFALLLAAIAIFPLTPALEHWWESNTNKLIVAGGLAVVTLAYYTFLHHDGIERHFAGHGVVEPTQGGPSVNLALTLLMNCILGEYVPFIILLFSLYTIAGGLRITGDLVATPATNAAIMAVGAILASFVGTTGAAMILIRLLLETNRERKHVKHTIVFFIFIVCNAGGLLLPLGDPPLFIGYLYGVDFLWTLKLVGAWAFVNGMLLGIYFLADTLYFHPHETKRDILRDETQTTPLSITGRINILWLACVVLCVGLLDPNKAVPGTNGWHPPLYLRESLQLLLVAISLITTPKALRIANGFNFGAILEVAALFIGIFITMQPALQYLGAHGGKLGLDTPTEYFWATGCLSGVLDNAPTYAVFFDAAKSLPYDPSFGKQMTDLPAENLLAAVSLGAVLMGALTYIGNGPNFMVRAIAEKSGVKMPSFFGYMKYSLGVLIPIFILLNVILSGLSQWTAW